MNSPLFIPVLRTFLFLLLGVNLLAAAPSPQGDLGRRQELALQRILRGGPPELTRDFVLADLIPDGSRRFTEFSGDVSGRYIGALASVSRLEGRSFPQLDEIVTGALARQQADGHFGAPLSQAAITDADMATLWGNGRMLIGLLEHFEASGKPESLQSARRLGDFLVNLAPRLNSEETRTRYNGDKFVVGYICWTQNLEGIVALYGATKDARYLALAREIAKRVDLHPAQHSHGFLSALRGVLELYRATGERTYLEQVQDGWAGVIATGNLLVQGAIPERLAPKIARDEGCSEADWLRLALGLWQETRRMEYLDHAERTLFSEFSFNQFRSGDFGHHTFAPNGIGADFAHAWWCCTFHGLRALVDVSLHAFSAEKDRLLYDMPVDGRGAVPGLSLRAVSELGREGSVMLEVLTTDGLEHELGARIPIWSGDVKVFGPTGEMPGEARDGYLWIRRRWTAGERITLRYSMLTRVVSQPDKADRVAFFHGPWLLAVDENTTPRFFDEPSKQNRLRLLVVEGKVDLGPLVTDMPAGDFGVPVARFRVDYFPGGYPSQPSKLLLRPLAEYTEGPDLGRLDFWFRMTLEPRKDHLDLNP